MTRQLRRLSWVATLFLISCASLPPAPEGNICVMDIKNNQADCATITAVVQANGQSAQGTSVVQIKDMDNWIAVSPSTWAAIQTYIGDLKQIAGDKCQ